MRRACRPIPELLAATRTSGRGAGTTRSSLPSIGSRLARLVLNGMTSTHYHRVRGAYGCLPCRNRLLGGGQAIPSDEPVVEALDTRRKLLYGQIILEHAA